MHFAKFSAYSVLLISTFSTSYCNAPASSILYVWTGMMEHVSRTSSLLSNAAHALTYEENGLFMIQTVPVLPFKLQTNYNRLRMIDYSCGQIGKVHRNYVFSQLYNWIINVTLGQRILMIGRQHLFLQIRRTNGGNSERSVIIKYAFRSLQPDLSDL